MVAAIVVPITVNSGGSSPQPATLSGTLTGSINITCSEGGCANFAAKTLNQPLDLDAVTMNCDTATDANGHAYDCLKIGAQATGRIGTLTIVSDSMDGLKIVGGHDLTIGGTGSSITCPAGNVNHKDGIQVVGPAKNMTLTGIDVNCLGAGNDQLFVDGLDVTNPPTNVYFVDGKLRPAPSHFHTVTINNSANTGVIGSLVCPNATSNPYQIGPKAVNPIDAHAAANGNTFPALGQGGCG